MILYTKNVSVSIGSDYMDAYLTRPAVVTGCIVLVQEIFGVTPAMRAIADDFAKEGYAVLVPDIYWRLSRNLDLGNGENDVERQTAVDYSLRYDETLGTADLVSCVDWLQSELQTAQRPIVMGFCLGGRMAVRVAAATHLSGMVSMYGVGLVKLDNFFQSIECPVQMHFGTNDNHNPPDAIAAVSALVDSRKDAQDEFFTYEGAEHAFYNKSRLDRFNPSAHELARQRALRFFEARFGRNVDAP